MIDENSRERLAAVVGTLLSGECADRELGRIVEMRDFFGMVVDEKSAELARKGIQKWQEDRKATGITLCRRRPYEMAFGGALMV